MNALLMPDATSSIYNELILFKSEMKSLGVGRGKEATGKKI